MFILYTSFINFVSATISGVYVNVGQILVTQSHEY